MRFAAVLLIVLVTGSSLLLSSTVTAQSTTDNQRIEAIEIKGNKRVAAGTVLSICLCVSVIGNSRFDEHCD